MIGIVFVINAVDMILKTGWLFYVVIVIAIIYAITSSIIIEQRVCVYDSERDVFLDYRFL